LLCKITIFNFKRNRFSPEIYFLQPFSSAEVILSSCLTEHLMDERLLSRIPSSDRFCNNLFLSHWDECRSAHHHNKMSRLTLQKFSPGILLIDFKSKPKYLMVHFSVTFPTPHMKFTNKSKKRIKSGFAVFVR
jgi:hypothetical protein